MRRYIHSSYLSFHCVKWRLYYMKSQHNMERKIREGSSKAMKNAENNKIRDS